jgi:hypothetical protein
MTPRDFRPGPGPAADERTQRRLARATFIAPEATP